VVDKDLGVPGLELIRIDKVVFEVLSSQRLVVLLQERVLLKFLTIEPAELLEKLLFRPTLKVSLGLDAEMTFHIFKGPVQNLGTAASAITSSLGGLRLERLEGLDARLLNDDEIFDLIAKLRFLDQQGVDTEGLLIDPVLPRRKVSDE